MTLVVPVATFEHAHNVNVVRLRSCKRLACVHLGNVHRVYRERERE